MGFMAPGFSWETLAVAAIWEMNKQMEDLSVYFFLSLLLSCSHPAFQIIILKDKRLIFPKSTGTLYTGSHPRCPALAVDQILC